jgi:hypothetical protein
MHWSAALRHVLLGDRVIRRAGAAQPRHGKPEPDAAVRLPQQARYRPPNQRPLEDPGQMVAAAEGSERELGPAEVERDVGLVLAAALIAEGLGDRGGHNQAREHHTEKHQLHRTRVRVEIVGDPAGVYPGLHTASRSSSVSPAPASERWSGRW